MRPLRDSLAAATCALLGSAAAPARATDFDAALLYWTEASRVTVNEGVFNLHKPLPSERFIDLSLVVDVMTGASPNGAARSNAVQTFTRPSGSGGYLVLPGDTPLDDTFQDTRVAVRASFGSNLGRENRATVGAHYSIEYDYQSIGASATLARDFNRHNTTLALGLSFAWDTLTPEGGIPVPFASMEPPGQTPARRARLDDKYVADVLLGITQVINRSTLARVNYTLTHGQGYQTDPFKIISVVDAAPGATAGDPTDYVYENRPDARTRHALYGVLKHHFQRDVIDLSYRYMSDDWGVTSHTAEARYRTPVGRGRYLEPQYRYYHQTATDFFVYFLPDDEAFPDFASADLRLGEFDAHTLALKTGIAINESNDVNLRIGYYLQMGDSSPPEAFGSLRDVDLFPALGAWIIQVGYSSRI